MPIYLFSNNAWTFGQYVEMANGVWTDKNFIDYSKTLINKFYQNLLIIVEYINLLPFLNQK